MFLFAHKIGKITSERTTSWTHLFISLSITVMGEMVSDLVFSSGLKV